MKNGFKLTGLILGISIGAFALCCLLFIGTRYFMDWYWFNFELKPEIEAEHKLKQHIEDSIKYIKEEKSLDEEWSIARVCTFIPDAKDSVKYKNYLLVFDYDSKVVEIPMTYPAGCPHYQAQVTIYKNGKLFSKPFRCEYTAGLCYEDKPAGLIKEVMDKVVKEINDSLKNIK